MVEWQAAADHNDPDAEFGLGRLYELGTGDLKQDYKQADYWYQKAAGRGNSEAQYRLALIWAAGDDDFPADLAEAYKWVLLAAGSNGVWGSLAADLKTQIERAASADEQTEGKKRFAAWKEVHAAGTEEPAVVATPSPPPFPSSNKAGGTGCPGWPFPTLPCTEQFPALPGMSGQAQAPAPQRSPSRASLDQLNEALAQIDCASLRSQMSAEGTVSISGTVPNAEEKAKLLQLSTQFLPTNQPEVTVDIVPPPLCRSLVELHDLSLAGLIKDGEGMSARLNNGSLLLRQGDPIKIEVRGLGYPVNLRIDYFSLDGEVAHFKPDSREPALRLPAGAMRLFGNAADGEVWNAGGAPFGTEMICVIATPTPLDLGPRSPVEQATDYLRDLRLALGRISDPSGHPSLIKVLLVRTSP